MNTEKITKRWLPHWYMPGAAHFVTYRLADSLPMSVKRELSARRDEMLNCRVPDGMSRSDFRLRVHKQLFARFDAALDQSTSIRWLKEPRIAAMVRENLYHHHGVKYHLLSYCIMPNHVHVLFLPPEGAARTARSLRAHKEETDEVTVGELDDKLSPLAKIMHSLKSYTANEANKILTRKGRFWQKESYDHWVRDDDELERIVNYIRGNPVKAGLVGRHEDWHWCSCHDRYLKDGDTSGWLGELIGRQGAREEHFGGNTNRKN